MKKGIFTLLVLSGVLLNSCQKDTTVRPQSATTLNSLSTVATTPALTHSATTGIAGTAVDTVKGYMRVQLAASATSIDNILIDFNPAASAAFSRNEDAAYLQGFGDVSLSSLTSNGIACAINTLPLTVKGTTVALKVGVKADGLYALNLLKLSAVPSNYRIWLQDRYLKDSLDFRNNATYKFNVAVNDTASYGSTRFSIVVRKD